MARLLRRLRGLLARGRAPGDHPVVRLALGLAALGVPLSASAQESADLGVLVLSEWTLTQTLVLGSLDGEWDSFGSPRLPLEGPDGELIVVDAGAPTIRVFNRDGRYIRDLGRKGEGPGEYQTLTSIGVHGDRVWIADQRLRRFTEFRMDGGEPRTAPLSGSGLFEMAMPIDRLREGEYLAITPISARVGSMPGPGPVEFPQSVVRLDEEMRVLDTLAIVQVESALLTTGGANIVLFDPIPSSPLPIHVGDRGRYQIERAGGNAGDEWVTFRIAWIGYGESADSLSKVFRDVATPVPDSARRRVQAQSTRQLDDMSASLRAEIEPLMRDRMPEIEPPVAAANTDSSGRLWLLRERYRGDAHWLVLNESLEPVARVPVPSGAAHALQFGFTGRDDLWVRIDSDLGVPSLVRYRIEAR